MIYRRDVTRALIAIVVVISAFSTVFLETYGRISPNGFDPLVSLGAVG